MTVFLALSLAVLIPLVLVLVESARQNAVYMRAEVAGNVAVRSALGEFHRELLKQYDLYFIDASYGTANASAENLRQHLQSYMEKNMGSKGLGLSGRGADFLDARLDSLTLDAARFAADDQARALREQVYAYMSADPAGAVLADILSHTDTWQGLLEDGRAWEEERKQAREDLQEGLREAREKAREDHTAQERQEAEEEGDNTAMEAIEEMDRFRFLPILQQVLGDTSGISAASSGGGLLSGRTLHRGEGLEVANAHGYLRADEATFDLYLGEKMGCYTAPLEKGRLKYQLEYILAGRETDRDNLEKVAEELLLIREAVNTAYLFTDSARVARAEAIAVLVSLVLFSPALKDLIKMALLFAWAYLESIQDLRILFDGGRVPLWKTSETWRTSLLGLLAPEAAIRGGGAGEAREGFTYPQYLQALLFLEGSSHKSLRAMDVMEMDIRLTEGNASFRMDWCLDAFAMTARVSSPYGYSCTLLKQEGYN